MNSTLFKVLPDATSGKMDGYSRDEWITPEIAKLFLEKNKTNRTLHKETVKRHVALIKSGNFYYGADTITFDTAGRMINGQHRCNAIIEADVAVRMCVIYDVHPGTQAVIDTGRKRSAADWLHILGYKDRNALAAAVRLVATYHRDPNWTTKKKPDYMENNHIAQFLEIHPDLEDSVGRKRINITPSAHAMTHYVLGRIDSKARDEFFNGLESGAGLDFGSPILALRNWLAKRHINRNSTRTPVPVEVAYIFKSWNYWRTGKSAIALSWRTEGLNPERFPAPL